MRTTTKPSISARPRPMKSDAGAIAPYEAATSMATPMQGTYVVAVPMADAQRRNLDRVKAACLAEAKMMAEDYFYYWALPPNKDTGEDQSVEGVSIEGAEMLMRNWGNCTAESDFPEDEVSHWMFGVQWIDLETGTMMPKRYFRQRKSESHANMDAERKLDIAFQIGQSKAIRNAIVHAIPPWLRSECMEVAKKAAIAKHEKDVEPKWQKYKKQLAQQGISEARIRRRVGLDPNEAPTAETIAIIHGIARAYRRGETTLEREFPDETTPEETAAKDMAAAAAEASKQAAPTEKQKEST